MALEIEDQDELGRLFDIDIINTDGLKAGRNASGKQERRCLICGCPAKQCASRRVHSLGELQAKVSSILDKAVSDDSANRVSVLAVKALLYEVTATPKPGLVDRNNNGSHKDMDFFTFMGSSAVLCPYFKSAFLTGLGSASPADSFVRLRELGKEAERQMFYETKGINTHKGAVFSLGIMCCAVGLAGYGHWGNTDEILRNCALMTKGIMASVCKAGAGITAGQMLYQKHRIAGIRGEAESGFPTVQNYGLKVLEKLLSDGKSWDEASANALMAIIAAAQDTNMMARSSVEKAEEEAEKAGKLIESGFAAMSEIRKVDELYIRDNLSPGGSADLLACGLFLHFLKKEEELD
ncbi:MAG: triphosphoribosyl-dephospho-CoA synthase [Sphaerochaetaceae bacterium]